MASLKNGSHTAMEQIYRLYWSDVLETAYKRLRDEEIAQDITQEIFISLWENRAQLQIQGNIRAYLQGAIKYKVINYFKSAIIKEKHEDDLALLIQHDRAVSAENALMVKDLQQEIDAALQELPERMRLIFKMSRKQEKTVREISTELDLSAQTVKNQISAALRLLKERLSYLLLFVILILLTQT